MVVIALVASCVAGCRFGEPQGHPQALPSAVATLRESATPAASVATAAPIDDPCRPMRSSSFDPQRDLPRRIIRFDPPRARTGDDLRIFAEGFPPGAQVGVKITHPGDDPARTLAVGTVDSAGQVEIRLTVPYMPELVSPGAGGSLPRPCVVVQVSNGALAALGLLPYAP